MCIATMSTIAKLWKKPRCPSTNEWIKKSGIYIQCNITQPSKKKKEILPSAATWMELEGIMLSEVSQSEKDKYHMISLMWNLRNKTEDHRGREGKIRQNQRGR